MPLRPLGARRACALLKLACAGLRSRRDLNQGREATGRELYWPFEKHTMLMVLWVVRCAHGVFAWCGITSAG